MRLRHESHRLLGARQWRELSRNITRSIGQRPQLLLKRTPYTLLFQCLVASIKDARSRPQTHPSGNI